MIKPLAPICFLICLAYSTRGQSQTAREIPLELSRFYQVSSTTPSLKELIDNDVATFPKPRYGWTVYPSEIWYEFPDPMNVRISKIRFYDGMGTAEGKPFKVFVISPGDWKRQLIATFTGNLYNEWVDVPLKTPLAAKYLVIEKGELFPNEMKLYGDFTLYTDPPLPAPVHQTFRHYTGVNGFEWNILTDPSNRDDFGKVVSWKMELVKPLGAFRHYMDWEKLEHTPGKYTFSPTRSGAWDYDALYRALDRTHVEVLVCFKTQADFIMSTYPPKLRDRGNPPARYNSDLSKPASYIEQARAAFQFAARYGRNKAVDPALLKVDTVPQWGPGSAANKPETGLGLIRYIECDNERDKWWQGRVAYQTGREYAANLSAFYDGDQGRLGPGVGVKAADPACKVVIGGIAAAEPDYIRAIIDWCKEFRNGSLCFDVINYHQYANNGGSVQYGEATAGVSPEEGGLAFTADRFLEMSQRYAGGKEVWVTESGYDIHQSSPQKVPAVGKRSVLQTQADWILRTSLLYSRRGISRLFFYQLFDDNPGEPDRFCTTGLADEAAHQRRPALDFLLQANALIGDYTYQSTLSSYPMVDRYTNVNGHTIYVLYMPTHDGKTMHYNLPLPAGLRQVVLHYPAESADRMREERRTVKKGAVSIEVTETPVFVSL